MSISHLVLGGARSGKSRFAEDLALQIHQQANSNDNLLYLATATAGDGEMLSRIEQHQQRRDAHWQTIEEPIYLADALSNTVPNSILLIDCLTLWLSNCLHADCWPEQRAAFIKTLTQSRSNVIMVSNEVGSGIVPMGELSRQFVDQSGWLHQQLAQHCTDVSLIVAGLPIEVKRSI